MAKAPRAPLATFDSRHAMRYVRFYPHPIERVWEAVTTAEQLDIWLVPICTVEPRLGGRCSFSWGSPAAAALIFEITEFEPPERVTYAGVDGGTISFILERAPGGTQMTFIHAFKPGTVLPPLDDEWADQPAGDDVPWRPGFTAGFHDFLDQLGHFLAGRWTYEHARAGIEAVRAGRPFPQHMTPEYIELLEAYRTLIREQCPPA